MYSPGQVAWPFLARPQLINIQRVPEIALFWFAVWPDSIPSEVDPLFRKGEFRVASVVWVFDGQL